MLAAAMARNGVKVLVLETETYPKFAIGESMILETSEIMRSLALVFDVPELEYFSAEHFLSVIGNSHGVKRHFSYMSHKAGLRSSPQDIIQAIIPKRPYGHELHIYRQDSDYFYAGVAIQYGATLIQNSAVLNVDINADGVVLDTKDGCTFRADYIVDAGGYKSILAEKNSFRHSDLKTNTRGIFTHMTGVKSLHRYGPSKDELGIPHSLSEGTLHHVFEGGWLWVIPFDNHLASSNNFCSVGLLLDPRVHGVSSSLSPEEEFRQFVAKFPEIEMHLSGARVVRPWVRAERLQYSSTEMIGDRFCLIGHAAGFIDPLFSKGLYTSLASVLSFGRNFLSEHRNSRNYSRQRFIEIEKQTSNFITANDELVANAIKSFAHARLWRQYSVVWILGAYLELIKLTTFRQSLQKHCKTLEQRLAYPFPQLALVGGGYEDFNILANDINKSIDTLDMNNEKAVEETIFSIRSKIVASKWIPHGHRDIARGALHLPRHKFTWRLLMNDGGILGNSKFRKHFFSDTNLFSLGIFMVKERIKYSRAWIKYKHSRRRRKSI